MLTLGSLFSVAVIWIMTVWLVYEAADRIAKEENEI